MSEPTQTAQAQTQTSARGKRRKLRGRIVNDTASEGRTRKTVIVQVERRYRDRMYGKYVKSRKKFHAHDEREQFRTGDLVEIRESRRLSATKRWVATRLIERPEKV